MPPETLPLPRRRWQLLAALAASAGASLSPRASDGDACLPLDVITLLKGETTDAVAFSCRKEIQEGTSCSDDCYEAIARFQAAHCYEYLSQPQHLQPRVAANTLVGLQGVWFGLYPASGIELVEIRYDPTNGMLSGTKLTGNQFVRAGRVSWEGAPPPPPPPPPPAPPRHATGSLASAVRPRAPAVSQSSCRVVSSMWAGAYTPRWDPCRLGVFDSDHMSVTLSLGEGEEEVLSFVRAKLPLLLDWDDPSSPSYGFSDAMRRCHLEPEDSANSVLGELWASLHHSKNTVLLDQALLLFPLVLLGGYQMGAHSSLAVLGAAAYCVLLCLRLKYTGALA